MTRDISLQIAERCEEEKERLEDVLAIQGTDKSGDRIAVGYQTGRCCNPRICLSDNRILSLLDRFSLNFGIIIVTLVRYQKQEIDVLLNTPKLA